MKKYLYTIIGFTGFLLSLFILHYVDGIIMEWAKHNYLFAKADLYTSFVKLFLLPLAVVFLSINNILHAFKKFDWKLFLMFFVFGAAILFKLAVYMPIPTIYKITIVSFSDTGGLLIGLGIILSLNTERK